ncbi:MAG TPA: glycoside hydrolase family 6 protein [Solirubrobacteraceae bacterium]|nr:glycoside hydrolase family 6 protein [Solirubrobacteraceae bacterium]
MLSILALACAASTLVLAPPAGARRGSTAARAHRHTVRHARRHARKRAKHHREVAEPSPPLTGPVGEVPPVEEAGPPGGTGAPPAGEAPASEEGPAGGEAPAGEEGPGAEEAKRSPADPFAATGLYVEPGSPASQTAAEWAREGRSAEAAQIEKIATRPVAKWFGDWTYGHGGAGGDVSWWVGQAAAARRLPLLVAYDLPWRDCSQYSSGGAADAAAYKKFIDEMAAGIAGRSAAVILEPDALSELECLGSEQQSSYYSLLSYAVKTLAKGGTTAVYLDAGHAGWQPAATIAGRLKKAGVAGARGFSLNVSSFGATAAEESYGEAIVAALGGGAHFVIDTSRNGRGAAPGGEWCNPPGRGLGTAPTAAAGNAETDALLWVKHPGTSDGTCNGGPAAGSWWPAAALELAVNSAG